MHIVTSYDNRALFNQEQTCNVTSYIPHHIVAWQASLAAYCLAHSCGMKTTDPPDDMQAEIQQAQHNRY